MKSFRFFLSNHKRTLYALLAVFLFSTTVTLAVPPASPYVPGNTLDPQCAPGSTNCTVGIFSTPAPIGNVTPNTGNFTSLTSTSLEVTQPGQAGQSAIITVSGNHFAVLSLRADEDSDTNSADASVRLYNNGSFAGEMGLDDSDGNSVKIFAGGSSGFSGGNGITVTQAGLVGLGTTTPQNQLQVSNLSVGAVTYPSRIVNPSNVTGSGAGIGFSVGTNASPVTMGTIFAATEATINDGYLGFSTRTSGFTSTEKMRINSLGYVGIGTTSPGAMVDIVGTSPQLRLSTSTTDATNKNGYIANRHYTNAEEDFLGFLTQSTSTGNIATLGGGSSSFNTATELRFFTAANNTTLIGTQRMVIDSAGNVGIGAATPGAPLHVLGSGTAMTGLSATTTAAFQRSAAASSSSGISVISGTTGIARILFGDTAAELQGRIQYDNNDDSMALYTNNAEAIRILSTRLVGIGQTVPLYLLHVGSSSVVTGTTVARFQNAGGTCDVVPSVAAGITCTSDERLKKNITTIENSMLDKVLALRPVTYNMSAENNSAPVQAGFLAQELESVFPDLVRTDAQGWKSVNYAGMIPYTIKAIQEMDLNIKNIEDLSRPNTWRENLIAWMGNASNGITSFFSKKVTTEQLCVGTGDNVRCITKEQLDQILDNPAQQPSVSAPAPTPEPDPEIENPENVPADEESLPEEEEPSMQEEPPVESSDIAL